MEEAIEAYRQEYARINREALENLELVNGAVSTISELAKKYNE